MRYFRFILLIILVFILSCYDSSKNKQSHQEMVFVSWNNICFDKAASVWLIKNYVDSIAQFEFVEFGKKIEHGIPFDVPGAELGRQRNISCFESIVHKYKLHGEKVDWLARLSHDIDVNKWGVKKIQISDNLEKQFNQLRDSISDPDKLIVSSMLFFDRISNINN